MFSITSRYYGLATLKWTAPDGSQIAYVTRRFLPPGTDFSLLLEHSVEEGQRLDNITAKYLDDPEQFWRVADANEAMSPFELTEQVGRKIRITLPQGVPGPSNA